MNYDVLSKSFNTLAAMDSAKTSAEIVDALRKFIQPFGFDSLLVTGLPASKLRAWQQTILFDGWPVEWAERYQEMGHFVHDPCVSQCRSGSRPFLWRDLQVDHMPFEQARVMQEATEYGLHDGLCIPIHMPLQMPAVVTISGQVANIEDGDVPLIEMACITAFRALANHQATPATSAFPPMRNDITQREAEILTWIAEGKSAEDVGCILGISRYTVERHLSNIREKLGVLNTTQAVVQAIRLGIIHP